jgi:RecB family endonuclease NucS
LGDHDDRDRIYKAVGVEPAPPTGGGWRLGGEGEAHRKLKLRVAQDPTLIGLPSDARATVERTFVSGDRVDIAFDVGRRAHTVVEVETYFAEPGVYQAIKYRALMEAEQGLPLGSGKVQGVLVAHACDERARALANRYGVRVVIVAP